MEEIKKMIENLMEADEEEIKAILPGFVEKVKEVGIENLLQEIPALLPRMMERMKDVDVKELSSEIPLLLPLFFDGMVALAERSEAIKTELSSIQELKINLSAPDAGIKFYIQIKDGKISGGVGELPEPDLGIEAEWEKVSSLIGGEPSELLSAYMSGDIKIVGDIAKGMQLMPLLEAINEEIKK